MSSYICVFVRALDQDGERQWNFGSGVEIAGASIALVTAVVGAI